MGVLPLRSYFRFDCDRWMSLGRELSRSWRLEVPVIRVIGRGERRQLVVKRCTRHIRVNMIFQYSQAHLSPARRSYVG